MTVDIFRSVCVYKHLLHRPSAPRKLLRSAHQQVDSFGLRVTLPYYSGLPPYYIPNVRKLCFLPQLFPGSGENLDPQSDPPLKKNTEYTEVNHCTTLKVNEQSAFSTKAHALVRMV